MSSPGHTEADASLPVAFASNVRATEQHPGITLSCPRALPCPPLFVPEPSARNRGECDVVGSSIYTRERPDSYKSHNALPCNEVDDGLDRAMAGLFVRNMQEHQTMIEVTHILSQIEQGDPSAAERLLPLVYNELRKLAAAKLAQEKPGQTLQATALVHEAYLRLLGDGEPSRWDSRGHFFAAAAEAMRRILVEAARRKKRLKRGGDQARQDIAQVEIVAPEVREDLLALDEALQKLAALDRQAAELVQFRYFAGLTLPEAAELMEISPRTADRLWAYARAWLHQEIQE